MIPAHELVGKGDDVVLIPGTFADRRTWTRVIGRLSARFRCLVLDPRGTNETPDPGRPFTADELAEDVLAAMDAAGVKRAHVVGHSLGACVAITLAARHPDRVRRMVAVSPGVGMGAYQEAILDLWEGLARSNVQQHTVNLGLVIFAFGRGAFENGVVRAIVDEMDRRPLERATVLKYIECDRRLDLNAVMKNVDAATLVLVGADDALTGVGQAKEVAESIPGARLEVMDGVGHAPHLEAPAGFVRLVAGFLASG